MGCDKLILHGRDSIGAHVSVGGSFVGRVRCWGLGWESLNSGGICRGILAMAMTTSLGVIPVSITNSIFVRLSTSPSKA